MTAAPAASRKAAFFTRGPAGGSRRKTASSSTNGRRLRAPTFSRLRLSRRRPNSRLRLRGRALPRVPTPLGASPGPGVSPAPREEAAHSPPRARGLPSPRDTPRPAGTAGRAGTAARRVTSHRAPDAGACARPAGLRFPGGHAARPLPAAGARPGSGAAANPAAPGRRRRRRRRACGAAGGPRRAARSFPGGGGGARRLSRERRRPERPAGRPTGGVPASERRPGRARRRRHVERPELLHQPGRGRVRGVRGAHLLGHVRHRLHPPLLRPRPLHPALPGAEAQAAGERGPPARPPPSGGRAEPGARLPAASPDDPRPAAGPCTPPRPAASLSPQQASLRGRPAPLSHRVTAEFCPLRNGRHLPCSGRSGLPLSAPCAFCQGPRRLDFLDGPFSSSVCIPPRALTWALRTTWIWS